MDIRRYDPETDLEAILRIYREVGWLKDHDGSRESFRIIHASGLALVATHEGEAEAVALDHDGRIRYLADDLPLCLVAAVATSRVARQQGVASRLTAEAVATHALERGSAVAILGIFDQGFYDRLGFGTGPYDAIVSFDPADLLVGDVVPRPPVRLTADDAERIHRARQGRLLAHGSCRFDSTEMTRAEIIHHKNGFGLGYADPDTGELTHHLWVIAENVLSGPYRIGWMAYRTRAELLELLALLRGLADQIKLVRVVEPPGVQLQDLLRRPVRSRQVTRKGPFEVRTNAIGWWQVRILDLPACVAAARLPTSETARFNLELTDPMGAHLSDDTRSRWPGPAGSWVVTLGAESGANRGDPDPDLPTLSTSIGTFTRLWLGVQPPSGLALTCRDLDAPADLLERLDRVLRLPTPRPDWDF